MPGIVPEIRHHSALSAQDYQMTVILDLLRTPVIRVWIEPRADRCDANSERVAYAWLDNSHTVS